MTSQLKYAAQQTHTDRPFAPTPPVHFGQTGIPRRMLFDLFLRRVFVEGRSSLHSLAESLKLSPVLLEHVFRHFREERVLNVHSTTDADVSFSLTDAGRRLAASRMRVTQYIGPSPVSLADYAAAVRLQSARPRVTKGALQQALSDLIISEEVLRDLGPALVSQRSLFLYGATGNGKTAIAQRLYRLYVDAVLVPYAIEVDGQVIVMHDPVVHRAIARQPDGIDPRWVLCQRPFLSIGGELTADMLELRYDDVSRTYAAPVHVKANNGLLLIDDFGRQMISPRRLLNRWIIPIDRRVDFLALRYGLKFEVPFELMLVLATNLDPNGLADAAFLRRLQSKIYLGYVDDQTFDRIFDAYVREQNLKCETGSAAHIRALCRAAGCHELRACLPRDLCSVANWVREFEDSRDVITEADFERAVGLYFARTVRFDAGDFTGTKGLSVD